MSGISIYEHARIFTTKLFVYQNHMKHMKPFTQKWMMLAVLAITTAGALAWREAGNDQSPMKDNLQRNWTDDTTRPKNRIRGNNDITAGELDRAMKELDRAGVEMDKTLKLDFSKMEKEIKESMAEVNKIDYNEIAREVSNALQKVDWNVIHKEVARALQNIDIRISEKDKEEMKKEMLKAKKEIEAAKINSKIDMSHMKESIEKGMAAARAGIEKAKKEIAQYREFLNELDKDGLINKNKAYKVEVKSGELFINGVKQSKEVNDKYRKYFKEEDFSIRNDGESSSKI